MTEVRLVKFKIKPSKKEEWLAWCKELEKRKNESVATLKNEGVVSESCFFSSDDYIYYFVEAYDLKKAKEAVTNNPHPIDKEHQAKKAACLEKVDALKNILHSENRS